MDSRPISAAFSFMRAMKPSNPCGDTRARARAAALSDAISSRCSRSPVVTRSFAFRCVVDAWYTSLRATVTASERSGLLSTNTAAVIIFVMLAIDRWLPEFSSQRI